MLGIDALSYEHPGTLHVAASGNRGLAVIRWWPGSVNVLAVGGLAYEGRL